MTRRDRIHEAFRKRGRRVRRERSNLAIVTAVHGREELTRRWLDYYDGWEPIVIAHTEPFEGNAILVKVPNVTSDKFNAAIAHCEHLDVDGVLVLGSDDWVSTELMAKLIEAFEEGNDFVGCSGLYTYELSSGRARYVPTECTGAGRVLSRALLERMDWTPYQPGLMSGIDMTMIDRMRPINPLGKLVEVDEECCLLDVKTENIHGFEKWGHDVDAAFVERFGL